MLQNKSTKRSSKSLLTGSLIAVYLIATPYFFYLYEGFPSTKTWETFFGTYTSGYYENVQVTGWTILSKLIPLLMLFIWFFTCRHWWYHAILVPICMYVFQIYNALNDDLRFSDSNEFFILAPIVLFALIFLYTIRTKIFDKIHNIDLSELNRGTLKGDLKEEKVDPLQNNQEDEEDDEDDEPLFMG